VAVEGGLSPAEIVVVDGGEIVVDEGESVDEFDGDARGEAVVAGTARGLAGVPGEERAEALAALSDGVERGVLEGGWGVGSSEPSATPSLDGAQRVPWARGAGGGHPGFSWDFRRS
jgi:hypothetical protein